MFMTNLGAAMLLLPVACVSGQLQAGLAFLFNNTTILDEIAIFALCSAFGQADHNGQVIHDTDIEYIYI